ncbi:MAG: substrate-binding domain-containing protein [Candidatus Sulfotelmatobacter sp.]
MKFQRVGVLLVFLLTFLTPCFAHHMAVVVNKDNTVENVTAAHLSRILRSEVKRWPDGKAVVLVLHRDSEGETETLERLNKMTADELKALIAAHKDSIVMADSDADVLKTVRSTPGAIGLVEFRSIDSTINVVRVDGKLPEESGYRPH